MPKEMNGFSEADLDAVTRAYLEAGRKQREAARALDMPWTTFRARFREAVQRGLVPGEVPAGCAQCAEKSGLERRVDDLEKELRRLRKERLTDVEVRRFLFGLSEAPPEFPGWFMEQPTTSSGFAGVPVLQFSDFHWGEVVKPAQVLGRNEYNLAIASARLERVKVRSIDLLVNHMVHKEYPGLVVLLNGDMLSGTIHEELTATNDRPTMPALLDLYGHLVRVLEAYADTFGKVMVIASAGGNHSRMTSKVPAKDKAYTNFDWLLSCLLEKWFENDPRLQFHVASSDDVQFCIYGVRFRMTHGDSFGGGMGFVGPLAPIARGNAKKKTASATYELPYDVLVLGHWHQYMPMGRVIVNGSLVGYNEFAMKINAEFEPPKQACWLVHPKWGITFNAPVFADEPGIRGGETGWVSWKPEIRGA